VRDRPSFTAAWVAGWRGLGGLLDGAPIAEDPYGVRFGGAWARALDRAVRIEPLRRRLAAIDGLARWAAYMQIRTRAIDDELLGFAGDQVVILGAGYDCRAARFADRLGGARVFEVDHPATQARKRAVVDAPGVDYLAWDFEARDTADLPAALAARGLDPARPTLTIWEGVTMYLTEPAIDATVAAIARLGGPGSRLVFTYFEAARLTRPPPRIRLLTALVGAIGEPFRFGWEPAALPGWLAARGFALESDRTDVELAAALLPPRDASRVRREGRHVAVARTTLR
jgi:methyltransferase (TIGR00027 family)